MTGEATVPSRCLHAVSRDGTIVNERGGATIVPACVYSRRVTAYDPAGWRSLEFCIAAPLQQEVLVADHWRTVFRVTGPPSDRRHNYWNSAVENRFAHKIGSATEG